MTAPTIDAPPQMQMYTIREAEQMLSLSRSVIYQLMKTGRLEYVHQGRSRRIPGEAIADYIALLRREAAGQ